MTLAQLQLRASQFLAVASGREQLLDNELVQLSQLMQSLALHCHNLAYVKMCSQNRQNDSNSLPAPIIEDVPKMTTSSTNASSGRQMPRMGTALAPANVLPKSQAFGRAKG